MNSSKQRYVKIMCKTAYARGHFNMKVTDSYVEGFCKSAESASIIASVLRVPGVMV